MIKDSDYLKGLEVVYHRETVDDAVNNLKIYIDSKLEKLAFQIAEEVSLSVVGESYYRYDSTSTYFPTLVMVFREVTDNNIKRRAQVKARLKQNNVELTDEVLDVLRERCNSLHGVTYLYGTIRGNYVSTDKRWKTTVFGASKDSIGELLETVCNCVDEKYEERNLSITTGRARVNPSRRTTPLEGVDNNKVNYQTDIRMTLYRVVLMVNGLARPIPLVRFTK